MAIEYLWAIAAAVAARESNQRREQRNGATERERGRVRESRRGVRTLPSLGLGDAGCQQRGRRMRFHRPWKGTACGYRHPMGISLSMLSTSGYYPPGYNCTTELRTSCYFGEKMFLSSEGGCWKQLSSRNKDGIDGIDVSWHFWRSREAATKANPCYSIFTNDRILVWKIKSKEISNEGNIISFSAYFCIAFWLHCIMCSLGECKYDERKEKDSRVSWLLVRRDFSSAKSMERKGSRRRNL